VSGCFNFLASSKKNSTQLSLIFTYLYNFFQDLTPLSPKYIASQGPIPQCFMDFWLMVWQQKCPLIVMLTKEVEGKKVLTDCFGLLQLNTSQSRTSEETEDIREVSVLEKCPY
jgi:protein tyrosine phosphatase